MSDEADKPSSGVRGVATEVVRFWRALPHRPQLIGLLLAWGALFHFYGNAVFGYLNWNASLFSWLGSVYSSNPDNEHCRLIPLVVLVLLYVKREELIQIPKDAWWPGMGIVLGALLLHVVGYVIQQTRLSVVALFLGVYGITGLLWGRHWLRKTAFPFVLFAFAVPIASLAETLTFPLRLLVTWLSMGVAKVLGIEVIRLGTQLLSENGFSFDVAPACSGIRSLTALLALITIYAFLAFRSWWRRSIIILSAFPLAVVGNTMRVSGVVLAAEAFGQDNAMVFHDWAGFVTFAVALAMVLGIGAVLKEGRCDEEAETSEPVGGVR